MAYPSAPQISMEKFPFGQRVTLSSHFFEPVTFREYSVHWLRLRLPGSTARWDTWWSYPFVRWGGSVGWASSQHTYNRPTCRCRETLPPCWICAHPLGVCTWSPVCCELVRHSDTAPPDRGGLHENATAAQTAWLAYLSCRNS